MNANDKWNLIVSNIQKKLMAKESEVQDLWEKIFADAIFFGYSKLSGEIDCQRNIHIGSYERTIPDIIIKNIINNKDLFIVELKQHNLPFNQTYKEQLFSYMRLLRVNVGILICNKIYLYVLDYDDNETSMEITFTKDNPNGSKFIELFSKNNYSENTIKKFIDKNQELKFHIQEIRKDIQNISILDLIKQYYASKYSYEEIELALKDLQISTSFNDQTNQYALTQTAINNTTPKFANRTYISTSNYSDYYEEPQDIDYIIIKTSQERVDFCNGNIYEATRYAWNVKVEHVRQYKYVLGVIKGIVRGVYCVDEWRLVTTGESVGRYEFYGYDAPNEIANRFLGKRIPPQYSKRGLVSPVLYKK